MAVKEIALVKSESLREAGFPLHGFTTRAGGTSSGSFGSLNLAFGVGDDPARVVENLDRLKGALATDAPLLRVDQVHGTKAVSSAELLAAGENHWSTAPSIEADALYGDQPAVLAVQIADCAPVLLADPQTRAVAAIHAGWRGAARGVLRNTVRAMAAVGAEPARLIAVIGPCICLACYEVGEEVARHFPESSDPIPRAKDKYKLDLGLAVEVSLIAAGLTSTRIERIDRCPSCADDTFFSYRAQGGRCGRGLGFISPVRSPD